MEAGKQMLSASRSNKVKFFSEIKIIVDKEGSKNAFWKYFSTLGLPSGPIWLVTQLDEEEADYL